MKKELENKQINGNINGHVSPGKAAYEQRKREKQQSKTTSNKSKKKKK
jgi:hypothetical protein